MNSHWFDQTICVPRPRPFTVTREGEDFDTSVAPFGDLSAPIPAVPMAGFGLSEFEIAMREDIMDAELEAKRDADREAPNPGRHRLRRRRSAGGDCGPEFMESSESDTTGFDYGQILNDIQEAEYDDIRRYEREGSL